MYVNSIHSLIPDCSQLSVEINDKFSKFYRKPIALHESKAELVCLPVGDHRFTMAAEQCKPIIIWLPLLCAIFVLTTAQPEFTPIGWTAPMTSHFCAAEIFKSDSKYADFLTDALLEITLNAPNNVGATYSATRGDVYAEAICLDGNKYSCNSCLLVLSGSLRSFCKFSVAGSIVNPSCSITYRKADSQSVPTAPPP